MSAVFSVMLPQDLADQLDTMARETERSRSFIIQKALQAYMAEFAELQIALDRLYDSSDMAISGEDLRNSLGV